VSTEALTIAPTDAVTARRPGEVIELSAEWSLDTPPQTLEARLFWFTRGKGTQDVSVVETQPVASLEASGKRRIKFKLPEAPYSFSGRLISLVWAVELVADDGASVRWEFTLSPDGKEILLDRGSANATRAR
jgi:hypothetical protein